MKKINRKSILLVSAMASVLCAGLAVSNVNTVFAGASEGVSEICNFYIAGASLRYKAADAGVDQNGIRFALAIEDNLYNSLLNESKDGFKDGVTVGGLLLPADLTEETELTKDTVVETVEGVSGVQNLQISFDNFGTDEAVNELAGVHIAYITPINFPLDQYNRSFMVSAYYTNGEETVYTETVTACMAEIAKQAAETETNEIKKNALLSYVKEYAVNVYYLNDDDVVDEDFGVTYGEKMDASKLPAADEKGAYTWYADKDFQTEFDFDAPILGTTNIYGKYTSVAELTGGLLTNMDETFTYDVENATLTQTLKNSTAKKGYAEFKVEAGADFYVSANISLTKWFKVASQGWNAGENDRLGFALVNANGETYRMQLRSVMAAVLSYAKGAKTALYTDEGVTSNYLLGSTNGTTHEEYANGYVQLKNTSNMNSVPSAKIAMSKVGNNLFFYVNEELVAVQEIEANFNGVPALLAYSFADTPAQVVTYTDITIGEGVVPTLDVQFKVDGEDLDTAEVAYGDAIAEAAIPSTAAGVYTWYADEAMETEFDFTQAIKADTVIYGKFTVYTYDVKVYVNDESKANLNVEHGATIDVAQLPTVADGTLVWYAEETFETEFDFGQMIYGAVSVYGKYDKYVDITEGLLTKMDDTFVYDSDAKTLTQTLMNSTARKGYAALNVEAGEDFYVSAELKLSKWIAVGSQGWSSGGENDRFGFALVNENGENYRMQLRSVMAAVLSYAKSDALYGDDNVTSKFLLGSTNGTTNEAYASGYVQLKNTSNINNVKEVKIAMEKSGNNLSFYVNEELVATQEIEADFNGVPALFAYSFADPSAQVITYSNLVITTGATEAL